MEQPVLLVEQDMYAPERIFRKLNIYLNFKIQMPAL